MTLRALSDRERRLLRFGGLGVGLYLALFAGFKVWRQAERDRLEYRRLVEEARALETRLTVYDDKAAMAAKLMEQFRFDPARLSRTSLVAQASAAIQKSAMQGGMMLGAIRESAGRDAGRGLSTFQIEGQGPAPAVLKFLHELGTVGFPLVTESVQISGPGNMGGGPLKLSLTLILLDFESWKPGEGRPDA